MKQEAVKITNILKFKDISTNFSIAKVLSILMVVIGHYFGGVLWIPTTCALFIFAFSSGYFTSHKYTLPFSKHAFWSAKIDRLAYPLIVINLFLLCLFILRGRAANVFSWATVPALFGLNGFLDWFRVPHHTPFGAGLWFFTLLILFYALYPLIAQLNAKRARAKIFLGVAGVCTTVCYYAIPMGHMLWMTVFAFIIGSYVGIYKCLLPAKIFILVVIACATLLLIFNLMLSYTGLNYFFILAASLAICGYLINYNLPVALNKSLILSEAVLHIYFIHTYLFVKSFASSIIVNFTISLMMILTIGYILSLLTKKLLLKRFMISNIIGDLVHENDKQS